MLQAFKGLFLTPYQTGDSVKASIKSVNNSIQKKLQQMVEQTRQTRAFLERVVYPSYLKAQMKRWMSEGRSDGVGALQAWKPLSSRYSAWKKVRYASAPGGGTKMLIATMRLFNAVTGKGEGHKKLISDKSIIIGVDVPYAKYVNASRPFFIFSDPFMDGLRDKYKKFISDRSVKVE